MYPTKHTTLAYKPMGGYDEETDVKNHGRYELLREADDSEQSIQHAEH